MLQTEVRYVTTSRLGRQLAAVRIGRFGRRAYFRCLREKRRRENLLLCVVRIQRIYRGFVLRRMIM